MRERRAVLKQSRKGKSGGQGNHASHARPPKDKKLPSFGWALFLMQKLPTEEEGEVRTWKDPRQPQQDKENAENRAIHQDGREMVAVNRGADGRKLKSDEHEPQPIQNERQGLPHRPQADTNRWREEPGAP